jgi:hypothetical protein
VLAYNKPIKRSLADFDVVQALREATDDPAENDAAQHRFWFTFTG